MSDGWRWRHLQVRVDEGVGELRLDRPEVRNAIDFQTAGKLEQAAHVIVLRGTGGTFSAGADLRYVKRISTDLTAVRNYLQQLNRAFERVEEATVPVIAAVDGHSLAGGFELLQCCDIVLVAGDAVLGDQHANFGLLPGTGGSQRLPKLIGRQRALALRLSGDWVRRSDAVVAGLGYQSFPSTELETQANKLARKLAARSPSGLSRMKWLVDEGRDRSTSAGVALEIDTFCDHVGDADLQEGLCAFPERRAPQFGGGRRQEGTPG